MSDEEWRPIPGASAFEASTLGRIRSHLPYRGLPAPRILAPRSADKGYVQTRVKHDDGRVKDVLIHQLVLLAFVGPRPDGAVTRHLNGDATDNRLSNIVYGSQSENSLDSVAHGTHAMARRTHCNHGHEFAGDNLVLRSDGRGRMCRECRRQASARKNAKRGTKGVSA